MQETTQTAHALGALVEALRVANVFVRADDYDADARIEFATDNSQLSRAATLFVCKGASFKREYLLQAIETGAVAYVSEIDYGVDIPCIIVSDIRRTLGCLADMAYDHKRLLSQGRA